MKTIVGWLRRLEVQTMLTARPGEIRDKQRHLKKRSPARRSAIGSHESEFKCWLRHRHGSANIVLADPAFMTPEGPACDPDFYVIGRIDRIRITTRA